MFIFNLIFLFQKYVEDHPDIVVIDPLPSIKMLTDRYTQYKSVVKELNKKGKGSHIFSKSN